MVQKKKNDPVPEADADARITNNADAAAKTQEHIAPEFHIPAIVEKNDPEIVSEIEEAQI